MPEKPLPTQTTGSRQHDLRKRDKFHQVLGLIEEIATIATQARDIALESDTIPIMLVATIESKAQRLGQLLEVRRG